VQQLLELLRDNNSVVGRIVTSGVILLVAVPLAVLLGRLAARGEQRRPAAEYEHGSDERSPADLRMHEHL
jgi:hypothetical protein